MIEKTLLFFIFILTFLLFCDIIQIINERLQSSLNFCLKSMKGGRPQSYRHGAKDMTFLQFLKRQKKTIWAILAVWLIPLAFILMPAHLYAPTDGKQTLPHTYEEFVVDVDSGHVTSVTYDPSADSFVYTDHKDNPYYVMEKYDPNLLAETTVVTHKLQIGLALQMAALLATLVFIYAIGMSYANHKDNKTISNVVGTKQAPPPAGQTKAPTKQADTPQVMKKGKKIIIDNLTFDDVAGYQQTKDSLQFLVTCLREQTKLEAIGSKMPHGVLLYGPPGTGKTLMAKAIACTAGVPFIYASGSQFMEIYVGTGAKNIRSIYEQARKQTPCVVFIDEIDAIGGSRNDGESNSERKHTLDALLVEMDGINENKGILTIAATNLIDELDPALTRSGRFDRKIAVPLPDRDDRLAILKVHARNKRLADDVDLSEVATMTVGFSGADLENILNESGIIALQRGGSTINRSDVEKATLQTATGGETKPNSDKNAKELVAYHEAGHAIAHKLIAHEPVMRVTIMGSTSGVGGLTFGGSEKGRSFPSKKQLEKQIQVLYAGRVAEAIRFGAENITVGASNDIERATKLIRQYIINYGMNDELGLLNMDVLMNTKVSMVPDDQVVEKARALSSKLYQDTMAILKAHKSLLDRLANTLLKKESLNEEEVNGIVDTYLAERRQEQEKTAQAS